MMVCSTRTCARLCSIADAVGDEDNYGHEMAMFLNMDDVLKPGQRNGAGILNYCSAIAKPATVVCKSTFYMHSVVLCTICILYVYIRCLAPSRMHNVFIHVGSSNVHPRARP